MDEIQITQEQEQEQDTSQPAGELVLTPTQFVTKNGAIYDRAAGRIVGVQPGGLTNKITPETSQIYHQARREQSRNQFFSGMKKGAGAITRRAVMERLGEAQFAIASDPSRGRASTYAFETAMRFMDWWPDRSAGAPGSSAAATLTLSEAAVAKILAFMDGKRGE